jgi:hypothetical protein
VTFVALGVDLVLDVDPLVYLLLVVQKGTIKGTYNHTSNTDASMPQLPSPIISTIPKTLVL